MTPKASIVIPCYNMGDFVSEALDSVLSYPDQKSIEIIVVNDGSNDNGYTKKVLENYNYSGVKIIHQENKRLGNARNTGINAAEAPFIIPLDSDNKLRHIYIDKGIEFLINNPKVCMVYSDNQQFGEFKQEVKVGPFNAAKLIIKNYIDACVVLRKSAWESVGGYDENMPVMGYEDWDLNLRLFAKGWLFNYLEEIGFDYRVRENSMLVNSNLNKDLLLKYMFNKEDLAQIKPIRDQLLNYNNCKQELDAIQKRKLIRLALKLEKPLKTINNLFK